MSLSPEEQAENIATMVMQTGCCIFWSDLLQEKVAFVRHISVRERLPSDIVVYTDKELRELFQDGKPPLKPGAIKIIHQAKKEGGEVTSHDGYQKSLDLS